VVDVSIADLLVLLAIRILYFFLQAFNSCVVMQLKICLNDARQDPVKYKSFYPCDFDKTVAPRLSAMKENGHSASTAAHKPPAGLLDRLIYALV
jgi:hypothetical protein